MRISLLSACAGALVLAFTSCAPTTPAGRIDRNTAMFDALPAKHREKVRDGEISRGMSYDAVYLAWGRPARRVEMMRPEGPSTRWDYAGTRPVYTTNVYGGYGRGRYGPYRSSWAGVGAGPEVVYVPYHRASVWFVDGRVDSWESVR